MDEDGVPRDNFGLADVLGVDLVAPSRGPVKNNYIALMGEHRLHDGLAGASRIIGGTHLMGVRVREGVEVPFRFIPDFPDLPMEEVYAREAPDMPAVTGRQLPGGGQVVYFGFNIGSLFWEALQADHGSLIANAVKWALRDQPRIRIDGPGLIDVAVRESDEGMAIALVNLSNPMAMRGPIRQTLPVGRQRVEVRLPEGAVAARGRLLVSDRDADVDIRDGYAAVEIPEIELLEALHLTWS
jgi:hypothetical protein